ncbi:TPA: type III-A CRISPR-associated RAMP protein Csm3 [Streptococcus suis]
MTLAKLRISATLLVETGLHIGASNAFAAIGATDSPVIKDAVTNLPIIPGSSLKGKIRSLLSKTSYNTNTTKDLGNDSDIISRNFGNSKSKEYKIGRMLFRDAFLINKDDLERRGVRTYTEVKFENTIDRITAEANPRQIERVIRDSEFGFELIYEVNHQSEQEIVEDMQLLRDGLLLLEMDYLGGSGSRGYGKVAFKDLTVDLVFGECDVERIQDLLTKEV